MNVPVTPRTLRLLAISNVEQGRRLKLQGIETSSGWEDMVCWLFAKAVRENAVELFGEERVREIEAGA